MVMPKPVAKGLPIIGIIFLTLAVVKFLQGEAWVVWAILGFLFGGFGIFGAKASERQEP
jgi:hypothetical protein